MFLEVKLVKADDKTRRISWMLLQEHGWDMMGSCIYMIKEMYSEKNVCVYIYIYTWHILG